MRMGSAHRYLIDIRFRVIRVHPLPCDNNVLEYYRHNCLSVPTTAAAQPCQPSAETICLTLIWNGPVLHSKAIRFTSPDLSFQLQALYSMFNAIVTKVNFLLEDNGDGPSKIHSQAGLAELLLAPL